MWYFMQAIDRSSYIYLEDLLVLLLFLEETISHNDNTIESQQRLKFIFVKNNDFYIHTQNVAY